MKDMILCILYFMALYVSACWLQRMMKTTYHCDDSNQGRECKNCTAPRLPR